MNDAAALTPPRGSVQERNREPSSPERLLDILLMFEAAESVTVQQISERFGASRSSTYRDLGFLKSRGFVEDGETAGVFRLGLAVERLATSAGHLSNLSSIARIHMNRLVDATRESVVLCRRSGNRISLLVGIDSPQALRVSVQAADNLPLHRGSFGKVLLAYQRPAVIDSVLTQLAEDANDPGSRQAASLRAELERIKLQGYTASGDEVEFGTRSVAVPVRSAGGHVLAALAVAGPAARLPSSRTPEILEQLHQAASAIAMDWSGHQQPAARPANSKASAARGRR